jgi:hypothetical protein
LFVRVHRPLPAAPSPCRLAPHQILCLSNRVDWRFQDALAAGILTAVAAPPAAVDLRAAWWAIGDQEDTGSCVGWASAEGVVRYHLVKIGKLRKDEVLSPRHLWMSSKETDEFVNRPTSFVEGAGTSLKAAVDICRRYGTVTNELLPFHIATKMHTGNENAFYATAAQRRITSYYNLGKSLNQWKTWLASNGPILVGLGVDQTWDNATIPAFRGDGIALAVDSQTPKFGCRVDCGRPACCPGMGPQPQPRPCRRPLCSGTIQTHC